METIVLFEHTVVDIAIRPGQMPPVRPQPVRHLLDDPDTEKALCGYVRKPGDIVDRPAGSYADPAARKCTACAQEAGES